MQTKTAVRLIFRYNLITVRVFVQKEDYSRRVGIVTRAQDLSKLYMRFVYVPLKRHVIFIIRCNYN
jgi:hypothetical protein